MGMNRLHRPLRTLAASAALVASASALLVGALVVPAGAAGGAPYTTKVSVTSNAQNLPTGAPASFTAKVSAIGHGVPGGQVTFTVSGADSSSVTCDAGNVVPLVSGAATCSVAAGLLAASGPFMVLAQYADTLDSTYQSSSASRTQNVVLAGTSTTVTSATDPSVTGEPLSFTAAVAPSAPATGSPTGTVTFSGLTCDGGSNTVNVAGGLAQCVVSAGLVSQTGTYAVAAAYSGDANYSASAGTAHQSVKPAATTVSLVPSTGTCTGDICSSGQGTSISFTATAQAAGTDGGTGTPTGTITFAITKPGTSASLPCDGGTNVVALTGGAATCTMSAGLPAIIYYKVTATLSAAGYQSGVGSIFENSALVATNITTSVPKTIGTGETFDVTAVVTPATGYTGSNLPTGYVNILVCGNNSNGNDGCQGGAAPVGTGGVATLTIGGGEYLGDYTYRAVYTGDSNFYSSTAKTRLITIEKSPTTTALTEPGGFYSTDGAAVAITATVAATNGAAGSTLIGPPTGNVTFTITDPNGNAVTCTGGNVVPLPTSPGEVEGSVTCILPPGTLIDSTPPLTKYTVAVNYSGDSDYVASNGRAVQFVVPAAT